MNTNPPVSHRKGSLVGASPIPTTGQKSADRVGINREKTVDGTGRKVAAVGEAAGRGSLGGSRATSASFRA